jgi:hypothetical protein
MSKAEAGMTEPDVLTSKIRGLQDWQTVAWRRIADPSITVYERREVRNHLKEAEAELRRCLDMMAERVRFRRSSIEDIGDSLATLRFKLLG